LPLKERGITGRMNARLIVEAGDWPSAGPSPRLWLPIYAVDPGSQREQLRSCLRRDGVAPPSLEVYFEGTARFGKSGDFGLNGTRRRFKRRLRAGAELAAGRKIKIGLLKWCCDLHAGPERDEWRTSAPPPIKPAPREADACKRVNNGGASPPDRRVPSRTAGPGQERPGDPPPEREAEKKTAPPVDEKLTALANTWCSPRWR